MNSAIFHHEPLANSPTAFRVVRLLPRRNDGLIRCHILHTNLARLPDYKGETQLRPFILYCYPFLMKYSFVIRLGSTGASSDNHRE